MTKLLLVRHGETMFNREDMGRPCSIAKEDCRDAGMFPSQISGSGKRMPVPTT